MLNPASIRAFSNTLFSKTAWIAIVALVASLLVVAPVGGQAAKATPAPIVVPTSISVGGAHACVVIDSGVQCWGDNSSGQLGVAGLVLSSSKVQSIEAESGATQVSAGKNYGYVGPNHTCAVVGGGVKCWGANASGQLGDSSTVSRAQPELVIGLTQGASQVSAGGKHTCAVVSGGVQCWGDNYFGQLGNGTSGAGSLIPLQVIPAGSGVTEVSASRWSTCAVVTGGVQCWGANTYGELGDGTTVSKFVPTQVSGLTQGATQVSAGEQHACAVVLGGVMCWGDNSGGQLGNGSGAWGNYSAIPVVATPEGSGVTQVSAGSRITCLNGSSGVKCWGERSSGALGFGGTGDALVPTPVDQLSSGVLAIAVGETSACAVRAESIDCWGNNDKGQLGNGDVFGANSPGASFNLEGITALASAEEFNCAVVVGSVKCWGNNNYGQLGDGTTVSKSEPVTAISSGATAVAVGRDHACAVVEAGVMCWGRNSSGRLGIGTTTDSYAPVLVSNITAPVTQLALGEEHSCSVDAVGLKCWGSNSSGRLGDGSGSAQMTAVLVSNITAPVTKLALGIRHSCAVDAVGLKCWGSNSSGRLGDGTTSNRTIPVLVSTNITAPVTKLALGEEHSCAVDAVGLKCWGENGYGELGVGTTTDSYTPVLVSTNITAPVSKLALGKEHSCAVDASGLKCWGVGYDGRLGVDPIVEAVGVPTTVIGLGSSIDLLSAGYSHTCAAVGAAVTCWGSNNSGALGFARTESSILPIRASGAITAASVVVSAPVNEVFVAVLKPELSKAKRLPVSIKGQRVTLPGVHLNNVQSVLIGNKAARIISSSGSEIVIEVPEGLAGVPQVTLASQSGIQTFDGVMQVVRPYVARSVKISLFSANEITKAAAPLIRKTYLQDTSVNIATCAAIVGPGASAEVKAATIAKSVSACDKVSGYSVKFKKFKTVLRTLPTPVSEPYVRVYFNRASPTLVN